MGDLEGIGTVVTGGLLARAVEPTAGEAAETTNTVCLNCGSALSGPYCHACGQKAQLHRSLRAFIADLFAGMFNFEGKIWRTLPMLAWRPGEMTRRYVAGERARFVSPVALYLFSVFAMFAVLTFNGSVQAPASGLEAGLIRAATEERASLERLKAERARIAARKGSTAAIDRRIASAEQDLRQIDGLRSGKVTTVGEINAPPWLRRTLTKAQQDPGGAVNNVQDAASKYSWLLIPLSLPFMWLLFPFNRRYHMYDHTVFVTYSLSFMMILVIIGGLLIAVQANSIASMLFFIPPIHMYRQMRAPISSAGSARWCARPLCWSSA